MCIVAIIDRALFPYSAVYYREKWIEKFLIFIAWHCIPKCVRKWVVIRAFCDATQGEWPDVHPDSVRYKDVMDRLK